MTFSDIFKSDFLENVSSVSVLDMLLTIALSFGLGLFIFLVYKKTYNHKITSLSTYQDTYPASDLHSRQTAFP